MEERSIMNKISLRIPILFLIFILSFNLVHLDSFIPHEINQRNTADNNISKLVPYTRDFTENISDSHFLKISDMNITESLIITSETTYFNETIYLYENITVNSGESLTLNRSTINFMGNTSHYFIVDDGAELIVINSNINSHENTTDEWVLNAFEDSQTTIINSTFSSMGFNPFEITQQGFFFESCNLVDLYNITISNSLTAITIKNTSNIEINNSNIINATLGLRLITSQNIHISDSSLMFIDNGLLIEDSVNFTVTDLSIIQLTNLGISIINSNEGILEGVSCRNSDDDYIIFIQSSNQVGIFNSTLYAGIQIEDSTFITIKKNYITDQTRDINSFGIKFINSSHSIISDNELTGNALGGFDISISLEQGENISVIQNSIDSFNGWGLEVIEINGITITGNIIEIGSTFAFYEEEEWDKSIKGGIGLYLYSYNGIEMIVNNTIRDISLGFCFDNSTSVIENYFSNTFFYLNNFIDNELDYEADNLIPTAFWYSPTLEIGNYWSNSTGIDSDENYIQDEPYQLTTEISDQYPLFLPNFTPIITAETTHDWFVANAEANGILQNITWTIDDDDHKEYIIKLNETSIDTDEFNDTDQIVTRINQTEGHHIYMCYVIDIWDNYRFLTVKLDVDAPDYVSPVLTIPNNISLYEVEPKKDFTFNCSEDHPYTYSISLNQTNKDEELSKGDWNPSNLSFTLGNLVEGYYTLNLTLYDILENRSSYEIPVYVTDEGPVMYNVHARNVSQDSVVNLYWEVYDAEIANVPFEITRNESLINPNSTTIVPGTEVYKFIGSPIPTYTLIGFMLQTSFNTSSVNIKLSKYIFNLTINCTDLKINSSLMEISVRDTIAPQISPFVNNSDQITEFEQTVFTWLIEDTNPQYFNVSLLFYDNTTRYYLYNYTNWVTGNITYLLDTNGSYSILNNSVEPNFLNLSIQFDATDWAVGDYRFEVSATDIGNNTANSPGGGFVVLDNTSITINNLPENSTIEYGTDELLIFNFTDNSPELLRIFVNNTFVNRSTWNGEPIIFNTTHYLWDSETPLDERLGHYVISVFVNDRGEHQANHSVGISIVDTIKPKIVYENVTSTNIPYIDNKTTVYHLTRDDYFNFVIVELLPTNYSIIVDSNTIQKGNYNRSITVEYEDFPVGTSLVSLILVDLGNNLGIYNFNLSMIDPRAPLINKYQTNKTNVFPNDRFSFEWSVYDVRPHKFYLYINETLIDSGNWNKDRIYLSFNVSIGVNSISFMLEDTSNNQTTDLYYITLKDNDAPIIHHKLPLAKISVYENESIDIYVLVEDIDPAYYELFLNESKFMEDNWSTDINVTIESPLEVGNLTITLKIYDKSGNYVEEIFHVEVFSLDSIEILTSPNTPSTVLQTSLNFILIIVMIYYVIKAIRIGIRKIQSWRKED